MATQKEVDAGQDTLRAFADEHVPRMFRGQITEDMLWNLALAVIDAAEEARGPRKRSKDVRSKA